MKALNADEKKYITTRVNEEVIKFAASLEDEKNYLEKNFIERATSKQPLRRVYHYIQEMNLEFDTITNPEEIEAWFENKEGTISIRISLRPYLKKADLEYFEKYQKYAEAVAHPYRLLRNLEGYYIAFTTWTGKQSERLAFINSLIYKIMQDIKEPFTD